jgi:hypothetical protein
MKTISIATAIKLTKTVTHLSNMKGIFTNFRLHEDGSISFGNTHRITYKSIRSFLATHTNDFGAEYFYSKIWKYNVPACQYSFELNAIVLGVEKLTKDFTV